MKERFRQSVMEVILSKIELMEETEMPQISNPRMDIWSSLSFNFIKRSSFDIFLWL